MPYLSLGNPIDRSNINTDHCIYLPPVYPQNAWYYKMIFNCGVTLHLLVNSGNHEASLKIIARATGGNAVSKPRILMLTHCNKPRPQTFTEKR